MKMIDAVGTFATEELFAFPSDAIPDPFADFPGSEERPHEGTASEDAECDREPEFGDVWLAHTQMLHQSGEADEDQECEDRSRDV